MGHQGKVNALIHQAASIKISERGRATYNSLEIQGNKAPKSLKAPALITGLSDKDNRQKNTRSVSRINLSLPSPSKDLPHEQQ